MRSSTRRATPAYALLAMVAMACQPIPPFEPQSRLTAPDRVVTAGAETSVAVLPPAGLPPAVAERLGPLIAAFLRDRGVRARTGEAEDKSYRLEVRGRAVTLDETRTQVTLRWRLTDPLGNRVGEFVQARGASSEAWKSGSPALLAFLAERAAPRIEALLGGAPTFPTSLPMGAVYVAPVDGSPDIRRDLLTTALREALGREGVPLAKAFGEDTYLVLGAAYVEGGGGQAATVVVYWSLIEPSGQEIGAVSQRDTAPENLDEGAWRDVAASVAEGAAEHLARMLRAVGPLVRP